jgi:hypothetical protein
LFGEEWEGTTRSGEGCQRNLTANIVILVLGKVALLTQLFQLLATGKLIIAMQ